VGLCPVQTDLSLGLFVGLISYHDDMTEAIVGTRSFYGMIRLLVARLRPKCVSTSPKRLPTLCGTYRDLHTSGARVDSEVESTSLLRMVRDRASEYLNLRSEVRPYKCRSIRASAECADISCLEVVPRKMMSHVPNGLRNWSLWLKPGGNGTAFGR
jgi:hypothetical protein